ncbi:MAG: radical SAM protein [Deltaproteobacteria bacterium]|nr:radical SAM protein [Deltaproteobacteria bacterium]
MPAATAQIVSTDPVTPRAVEWLASSRALLPQLRTNPALVKLDLYCKGLVIDESCLVERDGRPILRTRAGLGSGLELILPDGIWTNVPVKEDFAKDSPWRLRHSDADGYTLHVGDEFVGKVRVPGEPAFYKQRTRGGKFMSRVGVLQGTYIGIYPTAVCYYWTLKPTRQNCDFCSVGLNLGCEEEESKLVDDVVDTVLAARDECGITYVHFNTGYYENDTYLDQLEPYIQAVHDRTGLLIGVQTPPHPDFSRYDKLRKMGVNTVSFCFEYFNPEVFKRRCPGKAHYVGMDRYLQAIEYCAKIFDTTNGEIIAGPEPVEDTLRAIDWITDVGAIPTVCVFRPLRGTDAQHDPPPRTEEMIPVFTHLYERCMEKRLPIGIAHNVEVSIVLKPEECRYFSTKPASWRRGHRAKVWLMNKALRVVLAWRKWRADRRRAATPA